MPILRLLMRDASGQTGVWHFVLPANGTTAVVTPKDGDSLQKPNELDKPGKPLDLAHIVQWQLSGDWTSDYPVDVEVRGLLIVAPNAEIRAGRLARAAQEEAARTKQRQEQDALQAKYGKRSLDSPTILSTSLVAPDILALTIQSGKITPGSLTDYKPQTGDEKHPKDKQVLLARGGREIGWLIGPKREHLVAFEQFGGDPLLDFLADKPDTYTVRSTDDSAYAAPVRPVAVYRKSKPTDWAQPANGFVMRHVVYLRLPHPLLTGKTYTVNGMGRPERADARSPLSLRSRACSQRGRACESDRVPPG